MLLKTKARKQEKKNRGKMKGKKGKKEEFYEYHVQAPRWAEKTR